jgi:hypothetical protein
VWKIMGARENRRVIIVKETQKDTATGIYSTCGKIGHRSWRTDCCLTDCFAFVEEMFVVANLLGLVVADAAQRLPVQSETVAAK